MNMGPPTIELPTPLGRLSQLLWVKMRNAYSVQQFSFGRVFRKWNLYRYDVSWENEHKPYLDCCWLCNKSNIIQPSLNFLIYQWFLPLDEKLCYIWCNYYKFINSCFYAKYNTCYLTYPRQNTIFRQFAVLFPDHCLLVVAFICCTFQRDIIYRENSAEFLNFCK